MPVIRDERYDELVGQLLEDPIILAMASTIYEAPWPLLLHNPGTEDEFPKWGFMNGAIREYEQRGGKIQSHVGGVSEALIILKKRHEAQD